MTILGQHTVHELNDLVKALSYNVSQVMAANAACTSWAQRDPKAFADWNTQLVQAMGGWSPAVHAAMMRIDMTPELLWDTVPVESAYQACLTAYAPFDDVIRTFMQVSQCPLTFENMPQPTAPDLDLDAFKSADKAAKWIEKTGQAASGTAKSYAPVVALGVGALVAVVVAVRKAVGL